MPSEFGQTEDLIRRLPLPLAKLFRHATNAKSPLDQHQAAYFLWEAAVKLLAVSAVAIYAERPEHDDKVCEQLKTLSRPTLGEWRKIVRMLMPILAENDEGYRRLKSLMERSRDNLPRAAGLDAVLREVVEKKTGARSTVKLTELFDRLVTYRNMEVGHGAIGLRLSGFYGRMGRSLLAAIPEILSSIDVLVGRRLIYISDIGRQSNGHWLIERFELIGETPRRLDPLELPPSSHYDALVPERVYLESGGAAPPGQGGQSPFTPKAPQKGTVPSGDEPNEPRHYVSLYPLASFDRHGKELLYLNSYRDRKHCDYLCYSSGEVQKVDELCGTFSPLLSRVFGDAGDSKASGAAVGPRTEAYAHDHADDKELGLRTIGEFELLSKLGQGGMGVVYRAWQPSVGRQVALKCLFRAGDAKSAERFSREYRALGRVDHPHLVKVYTSGAEGDQWFYAMELIEGATLAAVCERLQSKMQSAAAIAPDTWKHAVTTTCEEARRAEVPLSTPDDAVAEEFVAPPEPAHVPPIKVESYVRHVVELIRQIATAAQKLHEAGVVHRDIKPGNIMLTADGGHAVLMDLGLAQLMDREKLTHTRQFVGTLRYASPEQVLAVDRLDGRSDVYSIGATLWELLTLRPMFAATDETPTPELMKRIQFEDAELVSKYYPGIPRDLEAIIAKCLEKNPGARYASAGELAADLERWLSDKPVVAQPTNWRYRAGKFLRRNRRRLAVATASIAVQVALVVGLYHWLHSPPQPDPATALLAVSGNGSGARALTSLTEQANGSTGAGNTETAAQHATLPSSAVKELWQRLEDERAPAPERFDAACTLAAAVGNDPQAAEKWKASAPFVVDYTVAALAKNDSQYRRIVDALRPAHKHLVGALAAMFRDPRRGASQHLMVTRILSEYAADSPDTLAGLVAEADPPSFEPLFHALAANRVAAIESLTNELESSPIKLVSYEKQDSAIEIDEEPHVTRLANLAVALYLLGRPERVWPLLNRSPDPRLRCYIIHRIHQFGGEPDLLVEHFDVTTDAAVRQAIVLAIGEFPEDQLPPATRATIVEKVAAMYHLDDDAGFHGAAEWLLRLWHEDARLEQLDLQLAGTPPTSRFDPLKHNRRWVVNLQLQPLSIIAGPVKFQIGSPTNEPARDGGRESKIEQQHEVTIDHSYAIAAHEVTIAEYKRFNAKYEPSEQYTSQTSEGKFDERCPVNNLSWYEAAEYCNWLSARDGIPKDQWCYQPNSAGKFAAGMKPVAGFLQRTGYRLPTEAEWEYACRAGTITKTYFGQSGELLAKYAWYAGNSNKHLQPVAQLKPNDFSLFDMLGNALEWCEDKYGPEMYGQPPDGAVVSDSEIRIIRSEKCLSYPENIRSARREIRHTTEKHDGIVGLRPVRTIIDSPTR